MPQDHIEKLGPCNSRQEGVKKRGLGHRLPSQAKYVIESVRKFFASEK